MPARKCGTCRFYQQSTLRRLGWCRNPKLHDERDRSLVGVNELPCDKSFYDFWEPRPREARPAEPKLETHGAKKGVPRTTVVYSLVITGVIAMVILGTALTLKGVARREEPTTQPPPPTATATAVPSPTTPPAVFMRVGNTDGDGVYIRPQPSKLAKGIIAHPDNTRLEIIGEDVQSEGQVWKKVRDDKGNEGWVPARYLVPDKN